MEDFSSTPQNGSEDEHDLDLESLRITNYAASDKSLKEKWSCPFSEILHHFEPKKWHRGISHKKNSQRFNKVLEYQNLFSSQSYQMHGRLPNQQMDNFFTLDEFFSEFPVKINKQIPPKAKTFVNNPKIGPDPIILQRYKEIREIFFHSEVPERNRSETWRQEWCDKHEKLFIDKASDSSDSKLSEKTEKKYKDRRIITSLLSFSVNNNNAIPASTNSTDCMNEIRKGQILVVEPLMEHPVYFIMTISYILLYYLDTELAVFPLHDTMLEFVSPDSATGNCTNMQSYSFCFWEWRTLLIRTQNSRFSGTGNANSKSKIKSLIKKRLDFSNFCVAGTVLSKFWKVYNAFVRPTQSLKSFSLKNEFFLSFFQQ